MNWFTGILVYVIVWWMVFFTVLPWGNRPPETVETGHADSAPDMPRLWLKALLTTGIAAVVFAVIYWVMESGMITFRGPQ